MKIRNGARIVVATAALLAMLLTVGSAAWAAHHFVSGLAAQFPAYDLGDAYVFESSRRGHTAFVLSGNPSPSGKGDVELPANQVFGQGGVYSMHIAKSEDLSTGFTLTFVADGDEIWVGRIDNANAAIGEKGVKLGAGKLGDSFTVSGDIQVWAGRAQEPFFGNGAGIPGFHESITKGTLDPKAFRNAEDLFVGAKTSAIVVEIPNSTLGDTVHYFITTAMMDPDHNEWVQVNREAHVLMPYIFFGPTPAVQAQHDQHRPDDDRSRLGALSNNIFRAASVVGAQADPTSYANEMAELLTPDLLTYKVGTKADYSVGVMNGRALSDDAMDTSVSIFAGKPMKDFVPPSGKYRNKFPYVIPAR